MKDSKISIREKVGYSLGDVGANLMFQMLMIFQLKFYTDVFGIAGGVASSILFIAPLLTSVLINPAAGIITDRTHTRWGKYRPWILWTSLPFCVFYFLSFYNPGIENKTLVAIYATISYVMLMAAFSFNNISYSALGGVMTGDVKERTSINTIRFIATTITQFVVQGLTLPLVNKFGGANSHKGWTITVLIYAAIAFACFIITFSSTRERISPPVQQQVSIRKDIMQTISNRSWKAMFALVLIAFITLVMWGNSTAFYFQYCINQTAMLNFLDQIGLVAHQGNVLTGFQSVLSKVNLIATSAQDSYSVGFSLFNMVGAVVQFLGIITMASYLANRFGKKETFIFSLAICGIITAMFYLPSTQDVRFIFILYILRYLAIAPTVPLIWAMVADVADHIEYVNHRRSTGFCFSGMVLAVKVGLGTGGAVAGIVLAVFGYTSGGAVVQSVSAIHGIRLAASIMPAIGFLLGIVALLYYPLNKRFTQKIADELKARRDN